ncbi:structural maintenance of chromosomes Smc2, partial [Kipferlia bialata]
GQGGISKAHVTLVIDNTDKKHSPLGYSQHSELRISREINMQGASKYRLNGKATKAKTIQDLFVSVHLNVNNPHFLIMQGRVMQMVNSKPLELLGLIEEAAGTRAFDTERKRAETKITSKDKRLAEVEAILEEDIRPELGRLKEHKDRYQQVQVLEAERSKVQRACALATYRET